MCISRLMLSVEKGKAVQNLQELSATGNSENFDLAFRLPHYWCEDIRTYWCEDIRTVPRLPYLYLIRPILILRSIRHR